MIMQALGGRRFILTLGCGMACTALVWFGKISDEVFASIIIATVGAYIAGNTVQAVKAKPVAAADGGES